MRWQSLSGGDFTSKGKISARQYRIASEGNPAQVLDAPEPLLLLSRNDLAVEHEACRCSS
jgi:hypothetical protein